jgi:hypothetical protein
MTNRQSETESPTPEYPTTANGERSGSTTHSSRTRATGSISTTFGGTTASTLSGLAGGATGPGDFSLSLELLAHGQLVLPLQHEQLLACISHRSGETHAPTGTTREIWRSSPSSSPAMDRRVMRTNRCDYLDLNRYSGGASRRILRSVNVRPVRKPLEKSKVFPAPRPSQQKTF